MRLGLAIWNLSSGRNAETLDLKYSLKCSFRSAVPSHDLTSTILAERLGITLCELPLKGAVVM